MHNSVTPLQYSLRPATAADAKTIRQIIALAHINPMGLNWQHFILAEDAEGRVIGCGQVKIHGDGSRELASIAVLPAWRGKGVARAIIEQLLELHQGRLYLTCRAMLGPMHEKFGFQSIQRDEMTPYFMRLSSLVVIFRKLFRQPNQLLVMRRD
jgi:N-acetylglutamate synthase-like GNAT family acetyltransferase